MSLDFKYPGQFETAFVIAEQFEHNLSPCAPPFGGCHWEANAVAAPKFQVQKKRQLSIFGHPARPVRTGSSAAAAHGLTRQKYKFFGSWHCPADEGRMRVAIRVHVYSHSIS